MKKKHLIVLVVVLLVIVIAGGFWLYKNQKTKEFLSKMGMPSINPMENFPSANPFEGAKINPFEDTYKNPFE